MTNIFNWRVVLDKDIKKLSKMTKVKQKQLAFEQTIKVGNNKRFKGECKICHMPANNSTKKFGWTFHHLSYLENELTYRHFKPKFGKKENSEFLFKNENYVNLIDFTSLYKLEVLRQVKEHPTNFRFVCSAHHQSVEKIDRFNPEKVQELVTLWQETRTKWINKPSVSFRWRK